MGVPARVVRAVDDELRARMRETWQHYVEEAARHRAGAFPLTQAGL
jgi:carbonic anhydrase/acetyltransferase-like protein (isoleucine patch superfamily)